MPGRRTVVIGDRNVLSTIRPAPTEGHHIELVLRSAHRDPQALAAALGANDPDAVVVFDPRPGEGEALARAGLPVAAWLIPPSPESGMRPDLSPFSLIFATDAQTAARAGGNESTLMTLPVSDMLLIASPNFDVIERAFFDGAASDRRDRFLQPVKHRFDVLHLISGASVAQLRDLMARCQIAIDLQSEHDLPARDRVGPGLAAGMLILAERPLEEPGLVEGEHLLTFSEPDELELLIEGAIAEPDAFSEIRRAGHDAVQQRRSSFVFKQLTDELLATA